MRVKYETSRFHTANGAFQMDTGTRVCKDLRFYPSSKSGDLGPRKAKRRWQHVSHQMSTMNTLSNNCSKSAGEASFTLISLTNEQTPFQMPPRFHMRQTVLLGDSEVGRQC